VQIPLVLLILGEEISQNFSIIIEKKDQKNPGLTGILGNFLKKSV
jgi:hypothetical protein